jgi:two-component system sensor histidine kinase CpxA
MRSVYAKVLLWCFGTLVFSLVAFWSVGFYLWRHGGPPFQQTNSYVFENAVRAYESGGRNALKVEFARVRKHFPTEDHLTDAAGVDLVSGENLAALLAPSKDPRYPHRVNGRMVQVLTDAAGKYRLIILVLPPPFDMTSFLPYYGLILLAVAGLCWLLAANIASPLRQLARTVDRFGAGDLGARVEWRRNDEIGELARAFNQMAERLQTLLTAERRLLQDISHELRSPLARLSFAAELTRKAPDRDAAVARLRKEIDRLADLVSGLIQVTRAEGDFADRNLTPVSLNSVVAEVTESSELEASAKHCRVEAKSDAEVELQGDPELLRRAVENVVRNAIRYAPESTAVEVKVGAHDSTATVSIRDYGPGVPDEMLPRIFTPFFRVDASRDTATGGMGLGLAIAQRAVLLHHGHMEAENANPGLRVTIALPLASRRLTG